jgi:hypothetical protein
LQIIFADVLKKPAKAGGCRGKKFANLRCFYRKGGDFVRNAVELDDELKAQLVERAEGEYKTQIQGEWVGGEDERG